MSRIFTCAMAGRASGTAMTPAAIPAPRRNWRRVDDGELGMDSLLLWKL
jgi:hypothetical protein